MSTSSPDWQTGRLVLPCPPHRLTPAARRPLQGKTRAQPAQTWLRDLDLPTHVVPPSCRRTSRRPALPSPCVCVGRRQTTRSEAAKTKTCWTRMPVRLRPRSRCGAVPYAVNRADGSWRRVVLTRLCFPVSCRRRVVWSWSWALGLRVNTALCLYAPKPTPVVRWLRGATVVAMDNVLGCGHVVDTVAAPQSDHQRASDSFFVLQTACLGLILVIAALYKCLA